MRRRTLGWVSAAAMLVGALGIAPQGCGQSAPPGAAQAAALRQENMGRATAPDAGGRRVLIVSIDGLRPDVLLRAEAPYARGLMQTGSFTMWAQTTAVSVTLPSHVSMLTGVPPGKHQIEWNRDLPFAKPVYPIVPTLFERAYEGYSTGMVAGKSKFSHLLKPGTLDWAYVPGATEACSDTDVAAKAAEMIRAHQPAVLFVHFPDVDLVGHKYGWGSHEQLRQVAKADAGLGQVLAALEEVHVREQTLIILSADHGGAGKSHGADDVRSRNIPWIINGPGVRRDYDLTQQADLTVRTEDTCATACWHLGIRTPASMDGKPVKAAFAPVAVAAAP